MLDCYYIEHWSLGFDLWIILRTIGNLLFARDAY
jgi:lipopolysaccharide/colanic/teichoic acid biosynthesis glycosyltransferase